MKKVFFVKTMFLSVIFNYSMAQTDQLLDREIGIRGIGLNNFGFISKKLIKENKYRRFRMGFSNLKFQHDFRDFYEQTRLGANFGIALGYEKRRAIGKKLKWVSGLEFQGNMNGSGLFYKFYDSNSFYCPENQYGFNVGLGVGFVLGLQYDISDQFYIGLETNPALKINSGFDREKFQSITSEFDFNTNAIALSFVYRFKQLTKKKKAQ